MSRWLQLFIFSFLAACTARQAPLLAEGVVLTRPIPGIGMGAGYLTLRNTSSQEIRIDKVSSPDLESVAMHESVLEDGISRMYELQEVNILPGQSVSFEAGGKHLMIQYPVDARDTVTLQFYSGTAMLLSINVKPEEK